MTALLMLAFACHAQQSYTLDDLQGAWWSDKNSPTADFAINADQVWLDSDAQYHPCVITDGNILVFELSRDSGNVEHKIISLDITTLVLENLITHQVTAYTRAE